MKLHRILYIVYVALVVFVLGYGLYSIVGKDETAGDLIAFNDEWKTEGGRMMDLSDMPRMEAGEKVVLTRTTPIQSKADDVWNLVSHNIYFKVYVNNRLIYEYHPEENITGKGYGDHIHRILCRPGGSVIRLVCEPIYAGEGSGFFKESYVGSPTDFNAMVFQAHGFSFLLSFLIVIFGVLVMVMFISSIGLKNTNYHMPALAMSVILGGVWSAVPTLVPHIFIHNQLLIRVVDYSCLSFIGFPLVVFVNSVTEKRRRIYERISFWFTVVCASLLYGLRIISGVDLHDINFLNVISCVGCLIVLIIVIIDDWLEHRKHRHKTLNRALYFGTFCFVIGSGVDLFQYVMSGKKFISNGMLMQMGFIIFILVMITQAQRRMMMEHQRFDNQQFVNNLLKYSFSGQDPEVIIEQMLAYLGEESGADRAYIFEDNYDGTFENTYEWCREGVAPQIDNLKKMPFDGVVQLWYEKFHETGYHQIEDLEKYKDVSEKTYNILKPQDIHSVIASPLEKEGGYIGFFGIDNPPADKAKELTGILRLLGFFFVVVMRQRDAQKQLIKYSYIDSLTGISNRRSLDEMKEKMEQSENPYGLMMCDINGLKRMNDEHGHDAGDKLIIDVADSLKEVFGDRRVFRMGGDEFLVIREGGNREQFTLAVREVRDMIEKKGRSVSIGTAFSSEGFTFDALVRMADERMYDDKRRYYEQHGSNRRRR